MDILIFRTEEGEALPFKEKECPWNLLNSSHNDEERKIMIVLPLWSGLGEIMENIMLDDYDGVPLI